jgi:ADP-ribosylglycohydrolase
MHDVLDPRDYVPDEAEQLRLSGYDVASLEVEARDAAQRGDVPELLALEERMRRLERTGAWAYDEPDDDAALEALFTAAPRIEVDESELPDRVRGAWLGRTVGNTLGKPVEGLTRAELEIYLKASGHWPLRGYLPLLDPLPAGVARLHPSAASATAGRFVDVPRDDDIDWTILALHLLEKYGRDLTTAQIAAEWLDRVPFTQTYTAERAAYRNLIHGITPPETATRSNPYREWIGALIRGDAFGYALPGDPGGAARLALVDARLTHTANGLYGELWAAALVAAALGTTEPADAIRRATAIIPARSRLAEAIHDVLDLFDRGVSHTDALDHVDQVLGEYPWVHTINNAALIAIGLLWGSSFIDAVGITITGGRDTDSNAATVGSVYGALHGASGIPAALVGTTHVRVRSAVRDFDRVTIDELTDRTLRVVEAFSSQRSQA